MSVDLMKPEAESSAKRREVERDTGSLQAGEIGETRFPVSLLGNARLRGQGNGAAHATALQHAQQTRGNRAVQRFLHSSTSTSAIPLGSSAGATVPTALPVQREPANNWQQPDNPHRAKDEQTVLWDLLGFSDAGAAVSTFVDLGEAGYNVVTGNSEAAEKDIHQAGLDALGAGLGMSPYTKKLATLLGLVQTGVDIHAAGQHELGKESPYFMDYVDQAWDSAEEQLFGWGRKKNETLFGGVHDPEADHLLYPDKKTYYGDDPEADELLYPDGKPSSDIDAVDAGGKQKVADNTAGTSPQGSSSTTEQPAPATSTEPPYSPVPKPEYFEENK